MGLFGIYLWLELLGYAEALGESRVTNWGMAILGLVLVLFSAHVLRSRRGGDMPLPWSQERLVAAVVCGVVVACVGAVLNWGAVKPPVHAWGRFVLVPAAAACFLTRIHTRYALTMPQRLAFALGWLGIVGTSCAVGLRGTTAVPYPLAASALLFATAALLLGRATGSDGARRSIG